MFTLVANDVMKQLYKLVQGTQTAGVRRRLVLTIAGNIPSSRGGQGPPPFFSLLIKEGERKKRCKAMNINFKSCLMDHTHVHAMTIKAKRKKNSPN